MEDKLAPEDLLRAFGPEKEAWKEAGNYLTAEELKRTERDFADLGIKRRTKRVYVVD